MKTKNLTFCIAKELVSKLEEYSNKTMIPKSRLVSRLLEEHFLKLEKDEKNNK